MPGKALVISADGFEDSELFEPVRRLREEGFEVDIATPGGREIKGKKGGVAAATVDLAEARRAGADGWDLLVLPGGKAPAALRKMDDALELVRAFDNADKPISAVCHGPQIILSALRMKGRRMTGAREVLPEIEKAGAEPVDEEVVVDGRFTFSRGPEDLPAFMRETLRQVRA